jgi:hypothetical protein
MMPHSRGQIGSLLLVGFLAVACQQVAQRIDPSVAQMDRFQQNAHQKNWSAIASETVVDCPPGSAGCANLHATHGDACMSLVMGGRDSLAACPSASDEARKRLDCTAQDYAAATAGSGLDAAARARLQARRSQALYCRANMETNEGGLAYAREAESNASGLGIPQGALFAGWAALYQAWHRALPMTMRDARRQRAPRRTPRPGSHMLPRVKPRLLSAASPPML